MSTTVKISELTSSAAVSAGDVLVTVKNISGTNTTRKATAAQLAEYVTSSITSLSVQALNATSITGALNSVTTNVATVSTNISLTSDHHILLVDASSGNRTITLPSSSVSSGRQFFVKKIDSTSNSLTVFPVSGETIDGEPNLSTTTQYEAFVIISDGSNWFVF